MWISSAGVGEYLLLQYLNIVPSTDGGTLTKMSL